MKKRLFYSLLLVFLQVGTVKIMAKTYYVDPKLGNNRYSGSTPEIQGNQNGPFKTIQHAVSIAGPGDIIKLVPGVEPYIDCINFRDQSGTSDKPIILDGQMTVLRGSRIVPMEKWQPAGKDLFKLPVELKNNVIIRYFLVFDDKIKRMGRTLKGTSAKLKTVEELKGGEWTYSESDKAIFVKLPPGRTPEDLKIAAPVLKLSSGVRISGKCSNLIIKNLVVEQFWNDGYNIHDACKNIHFENIMARDNGDDGISAHGTCEISVKNFISFGNGTGICHVGSSQSKNTNILICGITGIELLMQNSMNNFSNMIVLGRSARGIYISGDKAEITNTRFINERSDLVPAVLKMNKLLWENSYFCNYSVRTNVKKLSGEILEATNKKELIDPLAAKVIDKLKKIFGRHFPEIEFNQSPISKDPVF